MAKLSSIFKTRKKAKRERLACVVAVLQNGHELVQREIPMKRRGRLKLTADPNGLFAVPYYPFSQDEDEFLEFTRNGCKINVDYHWEGIATEKGELRHFHLGDRNREDVILTRNDYASLTNDDLHILIKIVPVKAYAAPERLFTAKTYRDNFFKMLVPSAFEGQMLALAGGISVFLLSCFVFGLKSRYVPDRLDPFSVGKEYVLPFISAEHFRRAPEALQEHLQRKSLIKGVVTYYQELTRTLLGVSTPHELIPTSTTSRYAELHADAATKIRSIKAKQDAQSGPAVAIPAIVGESLVGGMERTLDKVVLLHQSIDLNFDARKSGETFATGKHYDWMDYRQGDKKGPTKTGMEEAFKPKVTNRDLMYKEAISLADEATRAQKGRFFRSPATPATPRAVVGISQEVAAIKFAISGNGLLSEANLAKLTGIPYGSQPEKKKSAPPPPPTGEIENHIVERFIRGNRYQLDLCYELALKRNERTEGTMTWEWRIEPRGQISNIRLSASSVRDKKLEECVRRKISTWRFPRPRRGAVEIAYPIEFAPKRG